jgi:branched-chain amino acid transport system substrate-binding protein
MTTLNARAGSFFASALLLVSIVSVPSCNLIIDASTDSCESNEDCVNLENTECDTAEGVCVSRDKCQSNAECPDDQICRPFSPRTCVSLRQGNCQEIYPDDPMLWRDDSAFYIGVTTPLTGDPATGEGIRVAAMAGAYQFNKDGGVLYTKPIVLVICDDQADIPPAEDNGRTLAQMGVQAVIGPAYSGQTLATATGTPDPATMEDRPGTIANNVLVMSTSATSGAITGLDDTSPACLDACGNDTTCSNQCPGLVWRTSPSDQIQGQALAAYWNEQMEGRVRNRGGVIRPGDLEVLVLYKDDAYGDFLSDVIQTNLVVNGIPAVQQIGGPNYARIKYTDLDPNSGGVQPDPEELRTNVTSRLPDAIFIIGTGEVDDIFSIIESQWTAEGGVAEDRPFYFTGDGGLTGEVAEAAKMLGLRDRFRGSIPGTQAPLFETVKGKIEEFKIEQGITVGDPNVFGAAGAFDAVFLLAYSAAAAQDAPLTAQQLAVGFGRLVDISQQPGLNVGNEDIGEAYGVLGQADGKINLEGASGKLDFDLVFGEATSDIQIWCMQEADNPMTGMALVGEFSGLFYNGTDLVGPLDPGDDAPYDCPF